MTSRTAGRSRDCLARLPDEVRRQAAKAYELFAHDPRHPSVRFKRVHASRPIYSVRISLDYRAVGVLVGEEIVWFWIGPHDEYDRPLSGP
jgi:hypothetical protein